MRHRLLDDTTPDTNAAHQAPVAVNLPVLLANRVAQVHAPSKPPPQRKKIPEVVTTRSNHPHKPSKPLIRLAPCRAKSQKPSPNCASWVRKLDCFVAFAPRNDDKSALDAGTIEVLFL